MLLVLEMTSRTGLGTGSLAFALLSQWPSHPTSKAMEDPQGDSQRKAGMGGGGALCSSTNRAPSMGAGDKQRSSDYAPKHLKVIYQPNRLLNTIHLVLLP